MYTENDWYNYHPPFEDYLAHYGKSKRDGAPGRGSGRYALGSGERPRAAKKLAAQYKKADYYGRRDISNKIYSKMDGSSRKRIESAYDDLSRSDPAYEYRNNDSVHLTYAIKAYENIMKLHPQYFDEDDKARLEEARQNPKNAYWLWDDWDQGLPSENTNSLGAYLEDKGISGDEYQKMSFAKRDEFYKLVSDEVDSFLGEYGAIPLRSTGSRTISQEIADDIELTLNLKGESVPWYY